jgi:SpoVK/Ycf46/Vps4 family AAA+-type ATPase
MKTTDYKSFNYLENGDIQFSEYETIKSSKILCCGAYIVNFIGYPQNVVTLKVLDNVEAPKPHNFSDKDKIDNILVSFFNQEIHQKILKLGFCHKLGILLHGIEGTGKSTIIKYYSDYFIRNHNAIVFHITYYYEEITKCWDFIQNVRKIQDNPIIIIFDEFDKQMEKNEAFLKTVIDGNMSIDNCIFFAATNYLDKIPKAMSERPSRFKYCLNIEGMQIEEDIVDIIHPILNELYDDFDIKQFAKHLKGSTLDHIKQFALDKLMQLEHYGKNKKIIGFK